MSDDWRVRVDLGKPDDALALKGYLEAAEVEHQLDDAFDDRVAVSHDNAEVFLYVGTREQAERAQDLVRARAAERGWTIDTDLKRWHPVAEQWEDPDKPLPSTPREQEAEHEELIEQEREEAERTGYLEWEVRVQCRSHGDAVALADRLQSEGIPVIRRWQYLVVGAPDEKTAHAVAERVRRESPPGAVVTAEGSAAMVYSVAPTRWFSIFGGLGG